MKPLFWITPHVPFDDNTLGARVQYFLKEQKYPVLAIGWDKDGNAFLLSIDDRCQLNIVIAEDCKYIPSEEKEILGPLPSITTLKRRRTHAR